jgi:hypothetical protein
MTYLVCIHCGRSHEMFRDSDRELDRILTGTGIRLLCQCGHTGSWLWCQLDSAPVLCDLPNLRDRWFALHSARIRAGTPKHSPPGLVPTPGVSPEIAS